ncbi:MAG: 3-oxoacyl-ACP reductase family protein [Chloroflexota bacterium]
MADTNKVALVTGGSRGIGAAIAKRLAKGNVTVALTYNRSKDKAEQVVRDIEEGGGHAVAIQADANVAEQVIDAVAQVSEQFGHIDILVNNAGIFGMKPIQQATLADYDQMMNVNVRAVFAATAEAVKSMPEGGRIITIGSVNADTFPFPGMAVYGTTKAAVQALTKGWARDLGERKITVNAVQPGPIDTDMNPADGDFGEVMSGLTALKRYGQADEIANVVHFLASEDASYITGASIDVDGGMKL